MGLVTLPDNIQLDAQSGASKLVPLPDNIPLDGEGKITGLGDQFAEQYIPGYDYAAAGANWAGDKLAAGLGHLGLPVKPGTGDMSYTDALKDIRADIGGFKSRNPVSSTIAQTAGAITNPIYNKVAGMIGEAIPVAKTATNAAGDLVEPLMRRGGRFLAQSVGVGGLMGANEATGEGGGIPTPMDVLKSTGKGMAFGAGTAAVTPAIGKVTGAAIRKVADMVGQRAPAMTQAEIKAASQAAYKAASDAGVVVKPESFAIFVDGLIPSLEREGFDGGLHPAAANVLKRLSAEAEDMNPKSLDQLEILRRVANSGVKSAVATRNADEIRMANKVVNGIDDFIGNLGPSHLIAGDADTAIPALTEARRLWRTNAKMQNISDILDTAENLEDPNYIKQQFRSIVKNRAKFSQYSNGEKKIIQNIARTGVLEGLGKLAPSLDALGAIKSIGYLAAGASNPMTLGLPAAAMSAKALANSNRTANVAALIDHISRGGPPPPPVLSPNSILGTGPTGSLLGDKRLYGPLAFGLNAPLEKKRR